MNKRESDYEVMKRQMQVNLTTVVRIFPLSVSSLEECPMERTVGETAGNGMLSSGACRCTGWITLRIPGKKSKSLT